MTCAVQISTTTAEKHGKKIPEKRIAAPCPSMHKFISVLRWRASTCSREVLPPAFERNLRTIEPWIERAGSAGGCPCFLFFKKNLNLTWLRLLIRAISVYRHKFIDVPLNVYTSNGQAIARRGPAVLDVSQLFKRGRQKTTCTTFLSTVGTCKARKLCVPRGAHVLSPFFRVADC